SAVICGGIRLSYRDLDARASHLARRLKALGVGPEVRVGVCTGRSPSLAVAILGVLKAGAAFVPLDPAYPRERLLLLIEDAGVGVAVTEEGFEDALSFTPILTLRADENGGAPAEGDLRPAVAAE